MQSNRKGERGITLLLVAISLVVILGMAALAIDVVSLYVARTEAQRAADAAAMAAAKVIADTGFTSGLALTTTDVCGTGTSGAANQQAIAAAAQNLIAGQAASVQSVSCNLTNPQNPRVTVAVQRTGLPTFFSKIWGNTGNSVTATATAEAYNSSFPTGGGSPGPSISVASVKPFLIPNCAPGGGFTCSSSPYYFGANGALATPNIGMSKMFQQSTVMSTTSGYFVADVTSFPNANICPGTAAPPTNSCSAAGGGGLHDDIACANTHLISCGDTLDIDPTTGVSPNTTNATAGINCLTHSSTTGPVMCASPNTNDQDCFSPGTPVTIQGGISNPNPGLRQQPNISRSDSVVTVPVFDGTSNPCTGATCTPVTVIGFLQLGIEYVDTTGNFRATILNAAGCGPPTGTAISGGGVSPIPVRLVHN